MNLAEGQTKTIIEEYFGAEFNQTLADKLNEIPLAGGEWLFHQGDPGDSLFFLVRGRLQVWKESKSKDGNENNILLGEVVPGESVGEVGLLSGEARSAGIRAIRDSLLLKLDRAAFEHLAKDHPSLVMKLAANIAQLVQRSSSKSGSRNRRLCTVALLPLHDSPAEQKFCTELVKCLGAFGKTRDLSREQLKPAGAPVGTLAADDAMPGGLAGWLNDQESENRYVVYHCDSDATPWTRLALRQADIVLYVTEAGKDPSLEGWEQVLGLDGGTDLARPTLVLLQGDSSSGISGTAKWLSTRKTDFHLHVRADKPQDIGRVARIVSGHANGLVLAGGAARGIAHLGIYKAMLKLGIPVDWVGGVSIGSIMGAGIANDLDIDLAMETGRHALVTVKPFSDFTLPLVSLVRGQRMEKILDETFDQEIEDLPIPYFCVSCKLDDGALNIHEKGHLSTALRASASMPGIFPPAVVGRRLAVDGSVINNLPVDVMQQKPVGNVIAVDLSSQKTYEVPYQTIPSPWAVLRGQLLPFARRHRVPRLMTTMLKSTELGTAMRVQELGQRADLLLRPPVRKFGMTEVKAFDRMVDVTYDYAMKELSAWLDN